MKRAMQVVAYWAIFGAIIIAVSPLLLAGGAYLGLRTAFRWAELHTVYRGDEAARDRAEYRIR